MLRNDPLPVFFWLLLLLLLLRNMGLFYPKCLRVGTKQPQEGSSLNPGSEDQNFE